MAVMVDWYVSLADVVQHPRYQEGCELDTILYDLGMDTKYGYQDDGRWLLECTNTPDKDEHDFTHRSLSGDIVKCPRYKGIARSDGRWRSWVSHFLNLPAELTGANLQY